MSEIVVLNQSAAGALAPAREAVAAFAGELRGRVARLDDEPFDDRLESPGQVAVAFLAAQRSENTRGAYARDLAGWFLFLGERGIDPFAADRRHAEAYQRLQQPDGKPYGPATIARRLACVSAFYKYAISVEATERNPTAALRKPKVDSRPSLPYLSRAQARRLISTLHDQRTGLRERALVRLLLEAGLRVSEVARADCEDLGEDGGQPILMVEGKGRQAKDQPVALNTHLAQTLSELRGQRETGPLLVTGSGRRMTRQELAAALRVVCRRAEIPVMAPHSLRRTYATLALEDGVPLADVQDGMRHADPRTTRAYDQARSQHHRSPTHRLAALLETD